MTTIRTITPQASARSRPPQSAPLRMDEMNSGHRSALELTESARDAQDARPGFASQLFLGTFDPSLLLPFPVQTDEDRQIGDDLVAKVSALLAEHLDPEQVDETRTIPANVVRGLRDLGVFLMKVPKEYGGLGLSQVNYNRVILAIASYCGSTAVLVSAHQSIGVPQPLKLFGTDEQKAKYFARICDGALSAFALTEPEVGSDPARMKTTATLSQDGRYYTLNGVKQWTTNGPIAGLMVVMARTQAKVRRGREIPQITAFIVETESPGVRVGHRCDFMGLRGIQNGLIRFENVIVPAENVLWGEGLGLKLALKTLNTGRLTLPAACTGLGKQCLSIVRRWGNDRVQWGLPIGRHEAGSEKIAYIAATTFAMEAITWLTSHGADAGRDVRLEAALAKLFCSEASWRIIDLTMQFRAGRGYERATSLRARGETAFPVERMMRDARINTIIEGTSEIMRLFIAREALDPHVQRLGELSRDDLTAKEKILAGVRVALHYAWWYSIQTAGARFTGTHKHMGRLSRHYRYIDRMSHRLAAAMFHAIVRYRRKLEQRQVLLGHFIDIGSELFAMAAACAYAGSDQPHGGPDGDGQPERLADLFCRQARARVEEHFRALRSRNPHAERAVADQILRGAYRWLEHGVIPLESPELASADSAHSRCEGNGAD